MSNLNHDAIRRVYERVSSRGDVALLLHLAVWARLVCRAIAEKEDLWDEILQIQKNLKDAIYGHYLRYPAGYTINDIPMLVPSEGGTSVQAVIFDGLREYLPISLERVGVPVEHLAIVAEVGKQFAYCHEMGENQPLPAGRTWRDGEHLRSYRGSGEVFMTEEWGKAAKSLREQAEFWRNKE